jgi:hypothetical protein
MSDQELRVLERAATTGGLAERERYEAARDRVDPSWRFDKRIRELIDAVKLRTPAVDHEPLSVVEVAATVLASRIGDPSALLRRTARDKACHHYGLVVAVREYSMEPRLAVGIARRRERPEFDAPSIDECIRYKWPSLRPALSVEVLEKVRIWAGNAWVSRIAVQSGALKTTACAPEAVAQAWAKRVIFEEARS